MKSKKSFHLGIIFFLTIAIGILTFSGFACAEDIFSCTLGYMLDPAFTPLRISECQPMSGMIDMKDVFPGIENYSLSGMIEDEMGNIPAMTFTIVPPTPMGGKSPVEVIKSYNFVGSLYHTTDPFFLIPGTEFLYKHPLGPGYSPSVRILPFPLPGKAVPGWATSGSGNKFPGSLFPGIATFGGRFSYQTTPNVWSSMDYSDIGMPVWF